MTSLDSLTTDGSSPQFTYIDNPPSPLVEPLDGFATVDQVFDRFPEEVYNQSRDSHLYLFLQALCGDSGAGVLKKQSYIARLKNEGALLVYQDLDTFYTQSFTFPRLPDEIYVDLDPTADILTKQEWDQISLADDKYRNRIKNFFNATRLGNSPDGIALAAEAGSGIHCDVFENYKAYYDLLSDDPLGIDFQGVTNSPHEYVVIPRVINPDGTVGDAGYTSTLQQTSATQYAYATEWAINTTYAVNQIVYPTVPDGHFYIITAQTGNSGVTQPPFSTYVLGETFVQGNITYMDIGTSIDDYTYNTTGDNTANPAAGTYPQLDPLIESNMVHTIDELRPVGALMTIQVAQQHFVPIIDDLGNPYTPTARASSNNFKLNRFVTGNTNVAWPDVDTVTGDRSQGRWIQSGVENQQIDFPLVPITHPVIWQTVDNTHAYTDGALTDAAYGTDDFYGGIIPVYPKYRSEHTGPTQGDFSLIFPFLQSAPTDDVFSSDKAIAKQSTPVVLEARHN